MITFQRARLAANAGAAAASAASEFRFPMPLRVERRPLLSP